MNVGGRQVPTQAVLSRWIVGAITVVATGSGGSAR